MFKATLEKLVASVDGAHSAAVMNRFGVIVAAVVAGPEDDDSLSSLPDLGPVYEQIHALRELVDVGEYRCLSLRSQERIVLIRPLDQEYIAVFCVAPEVIVGRAKFKLRVAAPSLAAEL
ncbi:MAG: roadblock/LC7 domain-containing protein [Myxococcota bacterium]|nr:roadblock/LC7 domain-containing protein [Myxococcota bacterium]